MKPFTKNEITGICTILLVVFALTAFNLTISLRRSRDSQRRADIGAISDALNRFQKDFGFYPPSVDGKILACKGENFGEIPNDVKDSEKMDFYFKMLRGCDWGTDSFRDVNDDSYEAYLKVIPNDPRSDQGYGYYYLSSLNHYQIYAHLEGGKEEVGFRDGIVGRNLKCGIFVCSFGKSSGDIPLEKSIEEYENEMRVRREQPN